jgi:hypothetical protein
MEEALPPDSRDCLPLWSCGEGGRTLGHGEDQVRISGSDGLDTDHAIRSSHISEQVLAAGPLDQLVQEAPAADRHGWLFPHQQQHLGPRSSRRLGCGRQGGIEYGTDRIGRLLLIRHPPKQPGNAGDAAQRVCIETKRGNTQLAQPSSHCGVLSRVVENDEVRSAGDYRLEIGLDTIAQVRDRLCSGWVVAVAGTADHRRAGTDGEEKLGRSWYERNHPAGGRRKADGVAGIVYRSETAFRDSGAPARDQRQNQ